MKGREKLERVRTEGSAGATGGKLARLLLSVALFCGVALAAGKARAETLQEDALEQEGLMDLPAKGGWNVNLGAGVAASPVYPGASAYRARLVPIAAISYRDLLFAGPLGIGVSALNLGNWHFGPVLGFEGGRRQDEDSRLNGLGDIQPSLTAGLFAHYRYGAFSASGTLRQAVTHTGNGLSGLLKLDYRWSLIPKLLDFSAGPELEFASARFAQTWFGVNAPQSAASGLPVFTPGGGVKDLGLHAGLTYHLTDHVQLRAFGNLKEITGRMGDSPIVESRTQALFGVGAAYHF